MTAAKTTASHLDEDEPAVRALANAPIDADAFTDEEIVEIEAALAEPRGAGRSTEEILAEIAERAKREG